MVMRCVASDCCFKSFGKIRFTKNKRKVSFAFLVKTAVTQLIFVQKRENVF